ncbi:MAG: ribosome biogenesis GTP-binding protein YihA/YsxC [Firmicutes bacterium]|nr:ribosome biogenesis GTP-binding protein YihA/YsxC [Bacillota bacterium]
MKITTVEFVTSADGLHHCPDGDLPEVALAGRSNVGKSSLFNALVGRKKLARTSNTPGRTQLINYFLVNGAFHLVDLPGYGFAKAPLAVRQQWGKMIEKYLTGRRQLRGLLLLVDIRHQPTADDKLMLEWLRYNSIPAAVAAVKADKLSRGRALQNLKVIQTELGLTRDNPLVLFSSVTGQGREEVWSVIAELLG